MNQAQKELKPSKLKLVKLDPETGKLTNKSAALLFSLFGMAVFMMTIAVEVAKWVIAIVYSSVYYLHAYYPEQLSFLSIIERIFNHFAFGEVVTIFVIYCIGLPLALPFILLLPRVKIAKSKLSFGQFMVAFCSCMGIMLVGSYISNAFFTLFSTFLPNVQISNPVGTSTSSTPWWFSFLTAVIIAPILEELVFRKLLCDRLCSIGDGVAIILSALFFGLFHGNFYQVFYATMLGAILGFVYIKTGKVRYTIFYHMMVNFVGGILTPFLAEWGMYPTEHLILSRIFEAASAFLPPYLLTVLKIALYIAPSAIFYFVEGGILTIGGIGIAVLIAKRRELFLTLKKGPLPCPDNFGLPLLFNAGMIAAIAITVMRMTSSLLS